LMLSERRASSLPSKRRICPTERLTLLLSMG
jgi:hypothetical protein